MSENLNFSEITNKLPAGSDLLFLGLVGSQAYGLATDTSDFDYKGVYIQSKEDILSNNYIPQIEINKDFVVYELRRFLELLSTANPNVLELLYLPNSCIRYDTALYKMIRARRRVFLTKKSCSTYVGYAKTQLGKAKGINKKFNWEKDRLVRKTPIDFAKVVDRADGGCLPLIEWLNKNEYRQEQIGLTSLDGFRDCYKLYVDEIKWVNDNHRFNFEDRNYKGFEGDNSNEPRVSEVEKYMIDQWKGIVYWNREAYSTHSKEYREYQDWVKKRNPNRYLTNKQHKQDYDSKNIMHLVRLLKTAEEIPTQGKINVDRTSNRDYLLSIKNGTIDLSDVIKGVQGKVDKIIELFEVSDLPNEVDLEYLRNLELELRLSYGEV